jgi:hypothetical protein
MKMLRLLPGSCLACLFVVPFAAAAPIVTMTQSTLVRSQFQGGGTYQVLDFYYSSTPGAEFLNYTLDVQATLGLLHDPARLQDDRQTTPDSGTQNGNTAGAVDTWANTVMSAAAKVDAGFAATISANPAYYVPSGTGAAPGFTRLQWDVFDTVQFDDNNLNDHPEGPFTSAAPYHLARVVASEISGGTATFTAYDSSALGVGATFQFQWGGEGFLTHVDDAEINDVNSNDPGVVEHTFTTTGQPPVGWTNFELLSYTPNYGAPLDAPGAAAAANAMFTAANQTFNWASTGAPRGDYVWRVQVIDGFGPGDTGTLTVHVTQVPELSSLALSGLALLGVYVRTRRRRLAR